MYSWDDFLKQNKFSDPIINSSIIESVDIFNSDNKVTLNILLDDIISIKKLTEFIKRIKVYYNSHIFNDFYISLKYNSQQKICDYFNEYFHYIISNAEKKFPSITSLKCFETSFKNKILFINVNQNDTFVSDYLELIKNAFANFGINIDVLIKQDNKASSINDEIEKEAQIKREMALKQINLIENDLSLKALDIKNRQQGKAYSYTKIKINKIPYDAFTLDKYKQDGGETNVLVSGRVSTVETRKLSKKYLMKIILDDGTDSIFVKKFLDETELSKINYVSTNTPIYVEGWLSYDKYEDDVILNANKISLIPEAELKKEEARIDDAKEKRIEFSIHTKMTNLDGSVCAKDFIDRAVKFGHKAICFTDTNNVFAYPEIYKESKNKDIKIIYGAEVNYVDESKFIVIKTKENFNLFEQSYVVFDVETTGLSRHYDELIEIGACKIVNGQIVSRFSEIIKPKQKVLKKIKELTHITDEMLEKGRPLSEVLPEFLDYIKGSILVAHNAKFDIGQLENAVNLLKLPKVKFNFIDTLALSQLILTNLKKFNLDALTKYFKVKLEEHHRAFADAEATAECFMGLLSELSKMNINTSFELKDYALEQNVGYKYIIPEKINLLVKNRDGLRVLYKILSHSLSTYHFKVPRVPNFLLEKYRKNLLVGSGADQGPVFIAAEILSDEELENEIKKYDYIELQPMKTHNHFINGFEDEKFGIHRLIDIQKRIFQFANKHKKLTIASGNVYYLDKEQLLYRKIYARAPRVGGGVHYLKNQKNTMPENYFLTTNEMKLELNHFTEDEVYNLVVRNPEILNNKIDKVIPFEDRLYSFSDDAFKDSLKIPSIENEVKKIIKEKLLFLYGKNVHQNIKDRIERELKTIIKNKFSPIYFLSYLLVKKSNENGYVVGSRGSVGSSLAATLLGITEVNPLAPHYRCENADYQVFLSDFENKTDLSEKEITIKKNLSEVKDGYDLKKCTCPICGGKLLGDGHNIPFETFLGFDGDKIPDIDLNFSGEYQSRAHSFVRDLLGSDKAYRAGTVLTVADKTAYGYIKGYLEENNIFLRKASVSNLASRISGTQRTVGQHPGGIVILPETITLEDITPYQQPNKDEDSEWKTTHLDYHSFEANLLKLDILGHDDPTIIKFLMDKVKENPGKYPFKNVEEIPLTDEKVLSLFSSAKNLNLKQSEILSDVGTYAVPEFGTEFVRSMLVETKPKDFKGLVTISGLSHGTGIWRGNGDVLVNGKTDFGKISFDKIIACRDDIMIELYKDYKIEPLDAFKIMEFIRKGNALKQPAKWLDYEKIMKEHNVPDWYIQSAQKIEYLFPKAHAVAYVLMALRIAWFKIYDPILFYSAFFSKKMGKVEYDIISSDYDTVKNRIIELKKDLKIKKDPLKSDMITTYEVVLEYFARGYSFLPIDVLKSEASEFIIENNALRLPLICIDGFGEAGALKTIEERKIKQFDTFADFEKRGKANKTVMKKFYEIGALNSLKDLPPIEKLK